MDEERLIKRKRKANRDGNVKQLAEVSKELGDMYFETGRLEDALLEYGEQLRACEVLNDVLSCAIAHRMIGEVHASLGDYQDALTHQTLHLKGAREMKSILEEQRALATIGRTHFCLAEALPEKSVERTEAFAAAKTAYSKSLRLCNELERTDIKQTELMTMRARLLLNLGLVLEEQKEPHQAVDLIEKAAELCKKHKLDDDLHRSHLALGGLHERQEKFDLALRHYDKATEIGDSAMKAVGRLTKAELLLRIGKWSEARQVLVQLYLTKNLEQSTSKQIEKLLRIVVTICRAEESLDVETDTEARQALYEKLGDATVVVRAYDKAIEYYREMLSCAEKEDSSEQIGAALVSLVQTFRDAGRFEEAIPFARRELQLCTEASEICRSALNLADLLDSVQSPKSSVMEIYNLALNTARNSENRALEASILKEVIVYLEDIGESNEAEKARKKLNLIPDASQDSASETESENTNIGADICLEDLSDVEIEMKEKEDTAPRTSHRAKRGLVVKRNEKGETKLHVACIHGNIEEVSKLLDAGHPTNVRDHCGWTPLHEVANHGHVEIAKLLIKAGAHVNDPGGSKCGGVTPLHDAACCGHFSIISLLMKNGADMLARTEEGDTVLDCLEGWRDRVEDLSSKDQAEYDIIHDKLSAIVPKNSKNKKQLPPARPRRALSGLIDEDDQEGEESDIDIERISAGEDYRRTIASLKSRGRLVGSSVKQSAPVKKVTAPLIDSEETLVDDWLENDLDCTVREKTFMEDPLSSATKRKSNNSTPDTEKTAKRPRTKSNENSDFMEIHIDDDSGDSNGSEVFNIFDSRRDPRPSTKSMKLTKKRPRQVSLLKSGFTKDSVPRTPSPIISYVKETSNNFERLVEAPSELVKLHIRLQERVINLKLRFPEQREIIVASLMNDVSEKFEDETGCKIQITLTTMSGEVLLRESTLKDVNPVNGVIRLIAEIVENNVPPITDRYTRICKKLQIQPRETILKCLRICVNTSTFRVKPGDALDNELLPLLKSLEYQHKLQVLNLSSTSLYDLGDTLNNTIKQLAILQELHLQGCDIDHNCLLKIDRLPVQLRVLDLSYNPLGPECQERLYEMISNHRHLQTLNLRFCKLEKFQSSKMWGSLVNLDLSWNPISGKDECFFLQRQMLSLNLSNTCNTERSPVIREIMNGPNISLSTLEILELSSCDLIDSEVMSILANSPNLSKFIIKGNINLTTIAVNALLNRKPTLSLIDVSGCKKITDLPDLDIYIENPRVCKLIVSMSQDVVRWWLQLWRQTANAHSLPHDIIIFKSNLY